jgi:hypothetical protein
MVDDPQGMYDERRLAAAGFDPARTATRRVPDTNHYTVLFARHAAEKVADAVVTAAEAVDPGISGADAPPARDR